MGSVFKSVSELFEKWNFEDGLDRNMKDAFVYLFCH
jgi:hypothetical protein